MGGPVSNMSAFHYELSLAESQHNLRSNLLPLGLVKKGAYRHRALLFKVGEEGGGERGEGRREEGGRREGREGKEGGREGYMRLLLGRVRAAV